MLADAIWPDISLSGQRLGARRPKWCGFCLCKASLCCPCDSRWFSLPSDIRVDPHCWHHWWQIPAHIKWSHMESRVFITATITNQSIPSLGDLYPANAIVVVNDPRTVPPLLWNEAKGLSTFLVMNQMKGMYAVTLCEKIMIYYFSKIPWFHGRLWLSTLCIATTLSLYWIFVGPRGF